MHRQRDNTCKKIPEIQLLCVTKVGENFSGVCLSAARLYYVKQPCPSPAIDSGGDTPIPTGGGRGGGEGDGEGWEGVWCAGVMVVEG